MNSTPPHGSPRRDGGRDARRPDSASWVEAFAAGVKSEDRVARVLMSYGIMARAMPRDSRKAPYDLHGIGRFEVKFDRYAQRTDRVGVELECRGKPSGVCTSTATAWVFDIGTDEFFLIKTSRLRALVPECQQKMTGDDRACVLALLPLAILRRSATVLRISPEDA
jgi:hypothetical protein